MKMSVKSFCAFVLTLCVFTTIFLVSSLDSKESTGGSCGDNMTWWFDSDTGTLTISGSGEMYNYDNYDKNSQEDYFYNAFFGYETIGKSPWNIYAKDIKTVIIEDGVTSLGYYAFYDCREITAMILSESVTDIGRSAFEHCEALEYIDIPDSVTNIGDYAFAFCKKLKSLEIPPTVTKIGDRLLIYCESLTSFTIPDSVTSIGQSAFGKCDGLTSITIPDSVKSIGISAFAVCTGLTSITIPEGVENIGKWAFQECENLKSISLPGSVTSIGDYPFISCDSLTDIYYAGSMEDWNNISKGDHVNEFLLENGGNLHCGEVSENNETISGISVTLNGKTLEFDQPPVMLNDRVMVPVRVVAEAMGSTVEWDEATQSAFIFCSDRVVVFQNGSASVTIYDTLMEKVLRTYELDVPSQIIGDRTLTPVRAIGECLGAVVDWDEATQTVNIYMQ